MAAYFSKRGIRENRIANAGRWPVRLTRFQLVDDYEFPATNFPEFFFVEEGQFLHESARGTQSVREGTAILVHPGQRHAVRSPKAVAKAVAVTRLRYLPEWFSREYEIIVRTPDLLGLFFDQSWMRHPREEKVHVFATRGVGSVRIRSELDHLGELFREGRQGEPVARLCVLKLFSLLVDEHRRYWRGAADLELAPEVVHALDRIESSIVRGEPFDVATMPTGRFEREAMEHAFTELCGLSLADYAARRRAFHAAFLLLTAETDLEEIAASLGWDDRADFAKSFEDHFDIPPSLYRRKFAKPTAESDRTDDRVESGESAGAVETAEAKP